MKDIKVVIGSNFGDEGKGLMTDYFCAKFPYHKNVLNIRFNGGAQAGHTTVMSDGQRHVFSHFGAGSFNDNVTTYLSSYFLVDPFKFMNELKELNALGINPKVSISRSAKVVTIYDIFYNQMLEMSRGNKKHGSCGAGIWETVQRNNFPEYSLTVQDLHLGIKILYEKLCLIRDEYYAKKLKEANIDVNKTNYKEIWNSKIFMISVIDEIKEFIFKVDLTEDEEILNRYDYQVFEGAQGLLLDWDNTEYMPNLTASYTGVKNVLELIGKIKDKDIKKEVCYVTRSYFTRHGAGKFLTETDKKNLKYKLVEKTNMTNDWQGNFRYGFFDKDLFVKTVKKDYIKTKGKNFKFSVAVTHLDETKGKILTKDSFQSASILKREMNLDRLYMSFGETRETINYR